jgi:hypothetical protein
VTRKFILFVLVNVAAKIVKAKIKTTAIKDLRFLLGTFWKPWEKISPDMSLEPIPANNPAIMYPIAEVPCNMYFLYPKGVMPL